MCMNETKIFMTKENVRVQKVSKVVLRNRINKLVNDYKTDGNYKSMIMAAILKAYYVVLGGKQGIILYNIDKDFVAICKQAFARLQERAHSSATHLEYGRLTRDEIIYLTRYINGYYFEMSSKKETLFMNRSTVAEAVQALFIGGKQDEHV